MEKTPGVADYGIRMWQIPVGRINNNVPITGEPDFANLQDTMVKVPTDQGSFEDSAVSYFFGQSFTGLTTNPGADNTKRAEFFNPNGFGNRAGDHLVRKDSCGNIVYESHFAAAANWGVEAIDFGAGLPEATNGGGYGDNLPTDQYFFSFKSGQYLKAPYILGNTTKSSSKVKSGEEHDPAFLGSSPTPLIQYDSPEKPDRRTVSHPAGQGTGNRRVGVLCRRPKIGTVRGRLGQENLCVTRGIKQIYRRILSRVLKQGARRCGCQGVA